MAIPAKKVGEEKYAFETDWYDNQADLIRKYLLTYYPVDKTIDMVFSDLFKVLVRHKES